jgi:hypothetical protein
LEVNNPGTGIGDNILRHPGVLITTGFINAIGTGRQQKYNADGYEKFRPGCYDNSKIWPHGYKHKNQMMNGNKKKAGNGLVILY